LLVNEFYLELIKIKALPRPDGDPHDEKASFFALAGKIMKRLLIHHSRAFQQSRKSAALGRLILRSRQQSDRVEDVLSRLALVKPIVRQVVEMRVFEGLTAEEIAPRLGCAVVTVHRYWQFGRHWLRKEWQA
jgi:RNA polymerase sigma factor (sigma-70 family)